MNAFGRLGLVALVLLVVGGSLMTHRGVTSTRSVGAGDITLAASDAATGPRQTPTTDGEAVDLYGNEVSDAIATFPHPPRLASIQRNFRSTAMPRQ